MEHRCVFLTEHDPLQQNRLFNQLMTFCLVSEETIGQILRISPTQSTHFGLDQILNFITSFMLS